MDPLLLSNTDLCEDLPLHLCYAVLELAVIHYYAKNTFSYVSLPLGATEEFLLGHNLIYIAEAYDPPIDDLDLGISSPESWVRLVLTDAGKRYLEGISRAELVDGLLHYAVSATRVVRFSPYSNGRTTSRDIALKYMDGLPTAKLPQFLSHSLDIVRERAKELLDMSEVHIEDPC